MDTVMVKVKAKAKVKEGIHVIERNGPGPDEVKLSKTERQKAASGYLRGDVARTLTDPDADRFADADLSVLKFHGVYQQYDRDDRARIRAGRAERTYSCMVRVRVPGGAMSAGQWLALDALARRFGHGSIRLTTRQAVQFHGVVKGDLRHLIGEIDAALLTTFAACGDVMRNVMTCPAPVPGTAREELQRTARAIAEGLAPRTRAYHEIWIDGERVGEEEGQGQGTAGDEVEPWYGRLYLPRKFKVGLALPDDNCIDVFTQDLGFLARLDGSGAVDGYHVLAGGGMGMTFRKDDTFARLATPFGIVSPEQVLDVVRATIELFRDHGNRADRRHARLKYLIEERGPKWFGDELERRAGLSLLPGPALPVVEHRDHLGWTDQGDGTVTYGLHVENGRLRDGEGLTALSAVRELVETLGPGVRLTPHQNVLLTGVPADRRDTLLEILDRHGLHRVEDLSRAARHAMACPALPTCGLALADAERALPAVIGDLDRLLRELGLAGVDLAVRMTGCPNGCARPYTADIGFVGRGPGVYGIYAGGGLAGDRLADLLADEVPVDGLVPALRPVLARFAAERRAGEGFGDFWQRRSGRREPRVLLTGSRRTYDATLEGRPLPGRELDRGDAA